MAEQAYREVLTLRRQVLGEDHWKTLISRHQLAWTLAAQGRHRTARREYRKILHLRQRALGPQHPHTHETRQQLDELRHGRLVSPRHLT